MKILTIILLITTTRRCRSCISMGHPWTVAAGPTGETCTEFTACSSCPLGRGSCLRTYQLPPLPDRQGWRQIWTCWSVSSCPSMVIHKHNSILLRMKREPRYSYSLLFTGSVGRQWDEERKQASTLSAKLLFKLCLSLMESWDTVGTFTVVVSHGCKQSYIQVEKWLQKSLPQNPKSNKMWEGGIRVTRCISNILAGVEGNWNSPSSRGYFRIMKK